MKAFLELSSDCIIDYKFYANYVDGNNPDWVDDKKKFANGKNKVNTVRVLVSEYNSDGYHTGKLIQCSLTKDDILKLAEKIKEIEVPTAGIPENDLPF